MYVWNEKLWMFEIERKCLCVRANVDVGWNGNVRSFMPLVHCVLATQILYNAPDARSARSWRF
jgi:hypothetical protein